MVLSHFPYHEERNQPPQGHEAFEYRFLAMMQESADVFWCLSPEGSMQDVSFSWQTFTGQETSQCLGRGWLDAVHPEDRLQIEVLLQQTVTSGQAVIRECHLRSSKGVYHLIRLRTIPVRTADEALHEIILCGTDITRQDLTEQMSEAQVQLAVNASGVGMWDWDLVTNELEWTNQEKNLFGLSPDTPISYERFLTLVSPDDRERVHQLNIQALAENRECRKDFCAIWPDGSRHWLSERARGSYDAQGKPVHLMGTTIDITDLKQVEERITAILESITDGFVSLDTTWRLTYANRLMEALLERKREDLLGQTLWELLPKLRGSYFESRLHEAMETRQTVHFETRQSWLGRWFEVHIYPALDGLSIYFHDMTERRQAEEERERANRRIAAILESITDSFVQVDQEWRYTYVNRRAEEYAGQSRETLLGQRIWEVSPELVGTPLEEQVRGTMATRQVKAFEAWHPRWRRWLEIHVYPAPDGLAMYSQDITARKQAEEELRQSRDAFRLLTEAMPQLVLVARSDGRQEYANQQWYAYTGSSPEQTLGEGLISFCHPDDQRTAQTLWQTSLLTSQPFEVEARLREGKTGAYRWFLLRAVPLIKDGRVWKWLGTGTDIHAKKHTEEALRESEVRFRHLVQSNIIGITVIDLEGLVHESNDAFLKLVGYTREDLRAGRVNWKNMTPPEYQAVSAQAVEELRATGAYQPYEKEYLTKGGGRVPVLMGGATLRREGATHLAISFVVDLTARKEIERQKDLMLGMTSHELKTPLAALKGTLQLIGRRMKRVVSTEEHLSSAMSTFFDGLTRSMEDSLRQIDVQTNLINDLLDVSRITAGTLKLEVEPCDPIALVRETVEDLRVIAPERLLVLDVSECGEVKVLADRARIRQVVTNYVTNAIRYSPADQPIHIGLTIQKDVARVWVRDRGPGLTEEAKAQLWQRFCQIKGVAVKSGSGQGLGLGLYICQTLIAQHQGEVGVESTLGEGSTFWFTLPVAT